MSRGPLGIVAGPGNLPARLADAATRQGRKVVIAEMEGQAATVPGDHPVLRFRAERLGALFRGLRSHGVSEIVMAGLLHRPRIDPTRFDLKTLSLAPRVLAALRSGDDATLRIVVGIFESEGFVIRGAHEVLPDLVVERGCPTARRPDDLLRSDAVRGRDILSALGPQDVAQGCVVARGLCLGIESLYGTDALLAYVARHRPDRMPQTGGVFVKIAKPGQDLRVDMPVIGPDTVAAAAAAKLDGIALEAGRVMMLDAAGTVGAADARGLCLWAE